MTNEQFKIMLEYQYKVLGDALDKSVELMPLTADREMEWHYIGKEKGYASTAGLILGGQKLEDNPNYKQKKTGRYLALIPLYNCLDVLSRQIDELSIPMPPDVAIMDRS